jgi:hypothetical protein
MLQENIGITQPVVALGPFGDAGVAASQSDVQLALLPLSNEGIVMPRDGWIVGLCWTLSAPATAGQLTLGVSIDGTEDPTTTQTVTTQAEGYDTWDTGQDAPRVDAGQQVGVAISTGASWDATTADLAAWLFVVFDGWTF